MSHQAGEDFLEASKDKNQFSNIVSSDTISLQNFDEKKITLSEKMISDANKTSLVVEAEHQSLDEKHESFLSRLPPSKTDTLAESESDYKSCNLNSKQFISIQLSMTWLFTFILNNFFYLNIKIELVTLKIIFYLWISKIIFVIT